MQKYYYYVQKYCLFWGPCRNITIQEPGGAGFSCRAIFGVCADIFIFGEIFTSESELCCWAKRWVAASQPKLSGKITFTKNKMPAISPSGWKPASTASPTPPISSSSSCCNTLSFTFEQPPLIFPTSLTFHILS